MDIRDIENRFTHHPPEPENDQPARYEQIRAKAKELALLINDLADDSREKSLAVTHAEEAVFWANAAIARHG
jgi:hypothetical protein